MKQHCHSGEQSRVRLGAATPESANNNDSGQVLRLRSGQLKGSESNRTARMTIGV